MQDVSYGMQSTGVHHRGHLLGHLLAKVITIIVVKIITTINDYHGNNNCLESSLQSKSKSPLQAITVTVKLNVV